MVTLVLGLQQELLRVPIIKSSQTGVVCVLECLLIAMVPGGNGCSVSVQDGSMRNALMMMMSTQT